MDISIWKSEEGIYLTKLHVIRSKTDKLNINFGSNIITHCQAVGHFLGICFRE